VLRGTIAVMTMDSTMMATTIIIDFFQPLAPGRCFPHTSRELNVFIIMSNQPVSSFKT